MIGRLKKRLKKIIPFILIGILSSTAVLFSYDKGNEVQAAVVVDDIMVVTAILALCGVSFLGTEELWGDGNGWYPGIDAGQDVDEWIDDFNKPWKEEWDEKTKEYALEHGLIDENGNYNGGGSGDGGDDDDHKFPSWEKLKTLVKANGGNVATALGAYLPLLTGFAYSVLKDSGSSLADSMIDDGININPDYITSSTVAYGYSSNRITADGKGYSAIFYSDMPICIYVKGTSTWLCESPNSNILMTYFDKSGKLVEKDTSASGLYGYVESESSGVGKFYKYEFPGTLKSSYPTFTNLNDVKKYFENKLKSESSKKKYINPTSIGLGSAVKDGDQTGVDGIPVLPTLPINNFAKLPTMDELKDFFKKIGNDKDDKDKRQKDIDDFLKKITTPDSGGGETPTPDPTPDPDPGGGGSGGGGGGSTTDTPDKPDKDDDDSKKDYARDLQKIFPFCIPFDIVDCFKLFNAEPETPRVEIPIHFGVIEKDYTFVIDLKDFDNVALLLRSSTLILFIVGLGFATRNVIKW